VIRNAIAAGWAVFAYAHDETPTLLNRPTPNRPQAIVDAYAEWYCRLGFDAELFDRFATALRETGEYRECDGAERVWVQWVQLCAAPPPPPRSGPS